MFFFHAPKSWLLEVIYVYNFPLVKGNLYVILKTFPVKKFKFQPPDFQFDGAYLKRHWMPWEAF